MPAPRRRLLLLLAPAVFTGCGDSGVPFSREELLRVSLKVAGPSAAAVDEALVELFGTPDAPRLPPEVGFLDAAALKQAAGPVVSHTPGVTQGLYRRHCARCHGVTGDSRGPAAYYQHPYPRDFRRGVFKWKSTRRDAPPTLADLDAVLERGVPGTAMPSYRLLPQEERDIVRDYVVYLSIRGQVERELLRHAAVSGDSAESLLSVARDRVREIAEAWEGAEDEVVEVSLPEPTPDAIERGEALFHTRKAACAKCHGEGGRGLAVQDVVYDVWNQDRVSAAAPNVVDLPTKPSRAPALVGLTPRGGSTREVLFRRVHQGIAGTPMLAAGPPRPGEHAVLTDEEVADVTAYLSTLLATEATP